MLECQCDPCICWFAFQRLVPSSPRCCASGKPRHFTPTASHCTGMTRKTAARYRCAVPGSRTVTGHADFDLGAPFRTGHRRYSILSDRDEGLGVRLYSHWESGSLIQTDRYHCAAAYCAALSFDGFFGANLTRFPRAKRPREKLVRVPVSPNISGQRILTSGSQHAHPCYDQLIR